MGKKRAKGGEKKNSYGPPPDQVPGRDLEKKVMAHPPPSAGKGAGKGSYGNVGEGAGIN